MESKKFLTSDGTYCHILPDKIILGQNSEIEKIPEMNHSDKRRVTIGSGIGILLLASVFSFLYFTNRMVTEVWIFVLLVSCIGFYRLWIFRDTSETLCVEKKFISSTKLIKRNMGYNAWVIFFTSANGKKMRRFVKIYDSKEYEELAEKILQSEGLI